MNRPDEHFNLFGCIRRALGQPLDFIGDDSKTAAGFAGHGRLNRCVQRKYIGLLRDVVDEFNDVADFLRTLAEPLDTFRSILNCFANRVHAINRAAYGLAALMCDFHRMPGDIGRALGIAGHLFNRRGHRCDRLGRGLDFPGLIFGGTRHVRRRILGLLGRRVDHDCSLVDRRHELAQFFDGEIE